MQPSFTDHMLTIYQGNAISVLREMPECSVHCVVTSPPYWGLRDYQIEPSVWDEDPRCSHSFTIEHVEREMRLGANLAQSKASTRGGGKKIAEVPAQNFDHGFCHKCGAWRGCFGLEPTPELYISHAVQIFREVRRVLSKNGTLWLNIGDSYAGSRKGGHNGYNSSTIHGSRQCHDQSHIAQKKMPQKTTVSRRRDNAEIPRSDMAIEGIKPKDLVGIPWMLAFALRADGWWLRQDIIWNKPNPMPESVTDRCTKAHEYMFLLSKSERYYYDFEAIMERATDTSHPRGNGLNPKAVSGWASGPGDHSTTEHAKTKHGRIGKMLTPRPKQNKSFSGAINKIVDNRNKRSVWTISTEPFPEAHFATFPRDLVRPCILAGCPINGTVLDPFMGSGTTLEVARMSRCHSIGIELNPEYIEIAKRRLSQTVLRFS